MYVYLQYECKIFCKPKFSCCWCRKNSLFAPKFQSLFRRFCLDSANSESKPKLTFLKLTSVSWRGNTNLQKNIIIEGHYKSYLECDEILTLWWSASPIFGAPRTSSTLHFRKCHATLNVTFLKVQWSMQISKIHRNHAKIDDILKSKRIFIKLCIGFANMVAHSDFLSCLLST